MFSGATQPEGCSGSLRQGVKSAQKDHHQCISTSTACSRGQGSPPPSPSIPENTVQELFVTVCDKAEALTAGVPLYAENGQSAEEILYECALAMVSRHGVCCNSQCVRAQGREAASFELLTDSQTARKHYGIAFACLHLLRAESTSEADHTVSLCEVAHLVI